MLYRVDWIDRFGSKKQSYVDAANKRSALARACEECREQNNGTPVYRLIVQGTVTKSGEFRKLKWRPVIGEWSDENGKR